MSKAEDNEQEYGLLLQETKKPPQAVLNYLRLILNYRYGLEMLVEKNVQDALAALSTHGPRIRSLFLIKDQPVENRNTLLALGRRGQIPLFLLVPGSLVDYHNQRLSKGTSNIFTFGWEDVVSPSGPSLQQKVIAIFDELGIGQVEINEQNVAQEILQKRLERRLKHISTLPSLPDIVLSITKLLNDPATRIEDLVELLVTDPAIIHRLLQVINSPLFSGRRNSGEWTLREAVVRLGLKQVGAVAQQVKLINILVKPDDSPFNLRRFWEHSVGVAVIADKLYVEKLLPLEDSIAVDKYWIGALLHDVGKLLMGFFFWDSFDTVLKRMNTPKTPFHWAENRLKNAITHEYIGRMVMLRAKADPDVVEVVGKHNNTGPKPNSLICLVHVADNLCKDLGMGYLERERAVYSPSVLTALNMTEEDMEKLKQTVGEKVVEEIEDLVNLCIKN